MGVVFMIEFRLHGSVDKFIQMSSNKSKLKNDVNELA